MGRTMSQAYLATDDVTELVMYLEQSANKGWTWVIHGQDIVIHDEDGKFVERIVRAPSF